MEWWGWLTVTLGGIVLIANAIKAIKEIFSPMKTMQTEITTVKACEEKHEKEAAAHFKEIDEALQTQEATNQTILKALFHLVNHEIDGNGIEGLKKVRNELLNNITER